MDKPRGFCTAASTSGNETNLVLISSPAVPRSHSARSARERGTAGDETKTPVMYPRSAAAQSCIATSIIWASLSEPSTQLPCTGTYVRTCTCTCTCTGLRFPPQNFALSEYERKAWGRGYSADTIILHAIRTGDEYGDSKAVMACKEDIRKQTKEDSDDGNPSLTSREQVVFV